MPREHVYEYSKAIIAALIVAFFVITFVMQGFYVQSGSMRPTLEVGDRILVNKFIYRFTDPERSQIIVFRYPVEPKRKFIKRVIGVGGDTIAIIGGQVFVNDVPLEEDYTLSPGFSNYGPIVVPEDNYFVLGDNRNNSEDSRFWGFVPRENVLGQALLIFWPVSRAKLLADR